MSAALLHFCGNNVAILHHCPQVLHDSSLADAAA